MVDRTTETPAQKIARLAEATSQVLGGPVGLAKCGCPNRIDGTPPTIHICRVCGYEGGANSVHRRCAGCAYRRHERERGL